MTDRRAGGEPFGHATGKGSGDLAGQPTETERQPFCSDELLRGRKVVEIRHNGAIYRLQATRMGKLILTK
ncbi:MAG: hemin uptake protein HemP [Pseudomonadota bacterium]